MMKYLLLVPTLMILLFADPAFAQEGNLCQGEDLVNLFCGPLSNTLNVAFQMSISLGAVLAMLRIGYAGWLYMGSADMWSNKTKAKEVFTDAILGLLLLLAIWMILTLINPDILSLRMGTPAQ